MRMCVYAIFDNKLRTYSQPIFAHNNEHAIRIFTDAVRETNSPFGRHPNDYHLYAVGYWDDSTAELEAINPLNLASAVECQYGDSSGERLFNLDEEN